MANTLLTPSIIARESTMRLSNSMVMGGLVHRDYSNEFANVGDTITIRKPVYLEANEFSTEITVQSVAESSTPVKLDKHLDVSFAVTSKDLTLNITDFSNQFIVPAMDALAQKVDAYLCGLYADIPYYYGDPSGAPGSLKAIAQTGKRMNINKAPLANRNLVLDPEAEASLVVLDGIVHAEKSGSTDALRNANIGKLLGFNTFMDQNIVAHTKGTLDAGATAGGTGGAFTVTVASGGDTKTVKKGDLLTFADVAGTFTCTEDAETTSLGAATVKIYPAVPATFSAKAVTVVASQTNNLAFLREAFALVTRPLAIPLGAANSEVMNWNGISVRVVYGYDVTKKTDTISLDLLCGVKTLYPELACRLIGKDPS